MRFKATRHVSCLFSPAEYYVDLAPEITDVRMRTLDGRFATEEGQGSEKRWKALWDTGAILTVIPQCFLSALNLYAANYTELLSAFRGAGERERWYPVQVGLPGLPFIEVRAIVPEDVPNSEPRSHITIGRDILMRLCSASFTNMPYNTVVEQKKTDAESSCALGDSSEWEWFYRRPFPKGWIDALKRWHNYGFRGTQY